MAAVLLTKVAVKPNPGKFTDDLFFEIQFEVLSPLTGFLEWTVSYVASPEDDSKDIELDSLEVGPLRVGVNRIGFSVAPPSIHLIPKEDLLGVTVVLLSCKYLSQEFVRV